MAESIFVRGEFTDLSPLFEFAPRDNYLLTNLNIFQGEAVQNKSVILQDIVDSNYSLINLPTSRFSSEHNHTARPVDIQRQVELPYFSRQDVFTPADVMGKRQIGTNIPLAETEADLAQYYLSKHAKSFHRTNEKAFARALFTGHSFDSADQDTTINWAEIYDQAQITGSIDTSSITVNPVDALEDIIQIIEQKADGLQSDIGRYLVFATPEFYNGFKRNPVFVEAFKFSDIYDPRNPVWQNKDVLSNASFDIPGTSITVIKVTQSLIGQYLPAGGAVVIPTFVGDSKGAYLNIYGAGSGNFGILGTAQEFYSQAWRSFDNRSYHVDSENSSLPVNKVFGLSAAISAA